MDAAGREGRSEYVGMYKCCTVQYSTAIVHLFKLKMELHKFVQRKGKERKGEIRTQS